MKKPLELSIFRNKLPFRISQNAISMDNLEWLLKEDFDFNVFLKTKGKDLQRPLVWNLFQKQQLIISILKEIQLPPFYIIQSRNEDKSITYKVIDGKQRLTTILSFYKNEFPIIYNNIEYFYNDLSEKAKYAIAYCDIRTYYGYEYVDEPISDDSLIEWFERINFSGTPQDIEHLNNLKDTI